jgi:hypothetical protein
MTYYQELAQRIGTSASWIGQAVLDVPSARRIRNRLAKAISYEEADELGLVNEWIIARQLAMWRAKHDEQHIAKPCQVAVLEAAIQPPKPPQTTPSNHRLESKPGAAT